MTTDGTMYYRPLSVVARIVGALSLGYIAYTLLT